MDLIKATADLRDALDRLPLPRGITHVYNPLRYAWAPHVRYLERFQAVTAADQKALESIQRGDYCAEEVFGIDRRPEREAQRRRVVLVGMNPGPHGMAQTGVPSGDVSHALEILGEPIPSYSQVRVDQPAHPHPKRPVQGFACPRVEESGHRLWSAFKRAWRVEHLGFILADVFAVNFCPLVFWDSDGKNITPDKLAPYDLEQLRAVCAPYLAAIIRAMQPEVVICVGRFAEREVSAMLLSALNAPWYGGPPAPSVPAVAYLLHPSPRAGSAATFAVEAARVLAPYAPKVPMKIQALILRRRYPVPITFADLRRAAGAFRTCHLSTFLNRKRMRTTWTAALKKATGAVDEVYAVIDGREVRVGIADGADNSIEWVHTMPYTFNDDGGDLMDVAHRRGYWQQPREVRVDFERVP